MNASRSRRGQAAMEYLMTYGWAILIVLAIMGILVYLVKPQKVESCNIATPLQCESERYSVDTAGNMTVSLANIGSVGYYVSSTTCGTDTYNYPAPGLALPAGGSANVYFNCTHSPNLVATAVSGRDTFQDTATIVYYPIGSPEFAKTQQLEIVVRYK
ncbi:Uncharacterised protein [uncultured archaeon]|nr:Uncharacterised protein [uncultured archaeon]